MSDQSQAIETENSEDAITEQEQQVINGLRDRGFCVVIWTPSEIGNSHCDVLEDIVIERGNIFLEDDRAEND